VGLVHYLILYVPIVPNVPPLSMDLANLSIFPASASQARAHSERTWEDWGGGLSLEEYLKRDNALEDLPHAEGGKWIVWYKNCSSDIPSIHAILRILAPRQNASENLDFFASCETYVKIPALEVIGLKSRSDFKGARRLQTTFPRKK
jgi:hypothetical protein